MNFMKRLSIFASGIVIAVAVSSEVRADDAPLTAAQSKAVDTMIHDYLMTHPQVLIEALTNAEAKVKEQESTDSKKQITINAAKIYDDPASPILGNPKGSVTLVEFFDYRCPYCKVVAPSVLGLVDRNPQLKIVMKEFPILSPESTFAAQVALVAAAHGKYAAFHRAMFAFKGTFDKDAVLAIARSIGLDAATVNAQVNDPSIVKEIHQNIGLAKAIGVDGTPTFLADGTILAGAMDAATLQEIVTKLSEKKSVRKS